METKITWNKENASNVLNESITLAPKILSDSRLGRLSLIRNTLLAYFFAFADIDDTKEQSINIATQAFSIIDLLLEQNNQVHVSSDEMLLLEHNINFTVTED